MLLANYLYKSPARYLRRRGQYLPRSTDQANVTEAPLPGALSSQISNPSPPLGTTHHLDTGSPSSDDAGVTEMSCGRMTAPGGRARSTGTWRELSVMVAVPRRIPPSRFALPANSLGMEWRVRTNSGGGGLFVSGSGSAAFGL